MMKRNLIAAGVASAFFLAGPVLAGGDKNVEKDASVNSKTDTSVSSSTSTPLPSASGSTSTSGSADTSASVGSSGGSTSANEPQKKRGLDRADEAAGEQGKYGRDNAREKQDRR
ncbi:MAG TPA: hypothetical protein VG873_03760 [Burkholderiales bacterium]|nr:hypothetical protein [Burkholderiales bacterium]